MADTIPTKKGYKLVIRKKRIKVKNERKYPELKAQLPRTNGVNFLIKIRKKK